MADASEHIVPIPPVAQPVEVQAPTAGNLVQHKDAEVAERVPPLGT